MADKRKAPHAAEAARKRNAPTIDLTATDVTPPQAAPEPESDPQPTQETAFEPATAAPGGGTPDTPPPPPPSDEPPQATANSGPSPAAPAAPERAQISIAAMLLAGVAGGVIVAAALGGVWYAGLVPSNAPTRTDMVPKQQIETLQQQVDALTNRPAPSVDVKTVDALARRVAQLESALQNLPKNGGADPQLARKLADLQSAITPLTQRLGSVESAIKAGDTAVASLGKRIDDIATNATQARSEADSADKTVTQLRSKIDSLAREQASTVTRADIEGLQQKMTNLEQADAGALAQVNKSAAAASATRLALAAQALRNAVVSGASYQAELAQAKALGADANKLAPLDAFAASGVPGAAALSQQLRGLVPQMQKIAAPRAQASGSFLERLQASASNLVRISPMNAPTGDAPVDILARLEVDAAHNNIDAAAVNIGELPETAQAPAKDWLARVKARQAALAAADNFAAASARALTPVAQ